MVLRQKLWIKGFTKKTKFYERGIYLIKALIQNYLMG